MFDDDDGNDDIRIFRTILDPIWDRIRFRDLKFVVEGKHKYWQFTGQIDACPIKVDYDYDINIFFTGGKIIIRVGSCNRDPDIEYAYMLSDPDSIDKIHETFEVIYKRAEKSQVKEREKLGSG